MRGKSTQEPKPALGDKPLWICPTCGHPSVTKNMNHSCERHELDEVFRGKTEHVRTLFDRFRAMVDERGPSTTNRIPRWVDNTHVVPEPSDHSQLLPLLEQAAAATATRAAITLADAGYHPEPTWLPVVIPEARPHGEDLQRHVSHRFVRGAARHDRSRCSEDPW